MNVFKQLLKSFVSPKDMAAFRFQGIGKTILYVFLLMFIASIPSAISMTILINSWLDDASAILKDEVPAFEIDNGELTSELQEPVIKENPEFTFVFDSTGELTSSDVEQYNDAFALLKEEVVLITQNDLQAIPYSDLTGFTISKDKLIQYTEKIDVLLYIIIPIIFVIMYIFQTGLKFIGISFLALIGLILNNVMKRNENYKKLWVMSAYAVTIPTIFFAITDAIGIVIPFSFLLYWITASTILYLILKEVPQPKQDNL